MIPITGHTQLTALLGSPVAHSISPLMHNEAFHLLDLDYTYLCFNVNEENLETAVMGLKTCGIRGFNLTMPNKNKIVELLDELSPAARLIGAVNTVVNDNGRLTGYNTDGVGYMQAVRDAGYDVIGKTIIIMGAGGAATAICAQAALDGVKKSIFLPVRPVVSGTAHRSWWKISTPLFPARPFFTKTKIKKNWHRLSPKVRFFSMPPQWGWLLIQKGPLLKIPVFIIRI